MMRGWTANSATSTVDYLRDFVLKLDSASLLLRTIFSTSSGQPVAGATDPTKLVTREKVRWHRCRNIKDDFQSFADNISALKDSMPATLKDWWDNLGDRFDSLQTVLENCETIAFMIDSPERYAPWQTNYEQAATAFYADWYTKLRSMHEAARQFARLLNPQLPAARRLPPSGIPPLPPTNPTGGGGR